MPGWLLLSQDGFYSQLRDGNRETGPGHPMLAGVNGVVAGLFFREHDRGGMSS